MVDGKVVFAKAPSIFDLPGTSKMSKERTFEALDAMREEGWRYSRLDTWLCLTIGRTQFKAAQ